MMKTEEPLFKYSLDCGHYVLSNVEIRIQYSTDQHYIWCPVCEKDKTLDPYGRPPTAWRPIVGTEQIDPMHYVLDRELFILPNRIMRIQPRYRARPHRARPFPYVKGIRR